MSTIESLVNEHTSRVRPLEITLQEAWWQANTSGRESDFSKKEDCQNRLDNELSDAHFFERMKSAKADSKAITHASSESVRMFDLIHLQRLEKQIPTSLLQRMSSIANSIEKKFNLFRAKIDGRSLSDSQVRHVLKNERDSRVRESVWRASKDGAVEWESELIELVKLRNEAAKKLGRPNYHALMLELFEQSTGQVTSLFDELDSVTREPFQKLKTYWDREVAHQFGVNVSDVMPWHYQDLFFQEVPIHVHMNLDGPYERVDVIDLSRRYFDCIGLDVAPILNRSDLFERVGKSPHAFCTDIDRNGDVRVLANVVPNEYWMGTMLHELGHGVYSSRFIPESVPYLLRTDSHILTTEGVAMLFGRLSKKGSWLKAMGILPANDRDYSLGAKNDLRSTLIVFSRWCQVMFRFEKSMYENPDQDLRRLWWDIVEQYQQMRRPPGRNSPDYATKVHIVSAPVYYHNYMMGELFASQVNGAIQRIFFPSLGHDELHFVKSHDVGIFFREKVFAPGKRLHWNALTRYATGRDLSAQDFVADIT